MKTKINTEKIRRKRLALGLRQEDIARRVGVEQTTVSNWEHGKVMSLPDGLELAKALELDPYEMLS
jgi:transcriptional regulator with XRE-family HTH domain